MKKTQIISVITIFLFSYLVYGCKKKNQGEEIPAYKYGTVSSLLIDGKFFSKPNWTMSVLARKSDLCGNEFGITIRQKINNGFYRDLYERIYIGEVNLDKLGLTNVSYPNKTCDSIPYASFTLGDGDLRWYAYYPLKSQKNTVTLLDYNKATNEVSGTFDITFAIEFGTSDSRLFYPDTIRLHDCHFRAFLND